MPNGSNENSINIFLWFAIIVVILGLISYYHSEKYKKQWNIDKMENELYTWDQECKDKDDDGNCLKLHNRVRPTLNDPSGPQPLQNYYILSSYNSCVAGDFENSYVSPEALKLVIWQGARLLDFEIYSLDNKAVVASSPNDHVYFKGTYNHLDINTVLRTVSESAFNSASCPNYTDPLILLFRIKSNKKDVYNPLAAAIAKNFKNRLLPPEYGGGGKKYGTDLLYSVKFPELRNKVIIVAYQAYTNYENDNNKFFELVNLEGCFSGQKCNNDVIMTRTDTVLSNDKQTTKNYLRMVLPSLSNINTNHDWHINQTNGVQMNLMNFQNLDKNLKLYFSFFQNDNTDSTGKALPGAAFILKPKNLRYEYLHTVIKNKSKPEYSFAKRVIQNPAPGAPAIIH